MKFNSNDKKLDNHDKVDGNGDLSDLKASDLPRVMLPIKMMPQLCPDSHLIAYFYYNGELVSASTHFEMEECFVNKVRFVEILLRNFVRVSLSRIL